MPQRSPTSRSPAGRPHRQLLLALLCIILTPSLVCGEAQCSSALDCSLNGDCQSGVCVCNKPWKNSYDNTEFCSVLDTLPHPNDYVPAYGGVNRTNTIYQVQNITSWGGNILTDTDGLYHMYVSTLGDGSKPTGLQQWGRACRIDHAVAKDPLDRFEFHDTALPVEAHNSAPMRAPNNSLLIFDIYGFLYHSESFVGPWYPVTVQHPHCNNPAPALHPNGTMFVVCHNGGFQFMHTDDVFSGPWSDLTDINLPIQWDNRPIGLVTEDPYLWFDANGNWHLLAHRYDYRNGYPKNSSATDPLLVSGHAYSENGSHWFFNIVQQPFDAVIRFQNGTQQQCSTFERPHLLFNKDGAPTHLISAVSPYWSVNGSPPCSQCDARPPYSQHSCVVCKTSSGVDYTYTLVTALSGASQ